MAKPKVQPKKALVLGDDIRSFLSVVRSLGRYGVEVHAGRTEEPEGGYSQRAWYDTDDLVLKSRYVFQTHAIPAYRENGEEWKASVIKLMAEQRFDLVVPCSDPASIPLQQHRAELEAYGKLYVISDEAFDTFSDKFKTAALAREVGVPVPREALVTSIEDAHKVASSFALPLVIKPRSSFLAENLGARHSVKKCYSWDDFFDEIPRMIASETVAVQENVIGQGVGVELLLKDGEPLIVFQHVRVHEPLHGGGSSYRMSVPVSADLLAASLKLFRPFRYTGVAMVEFKVDPVSGHWALIEVNARFWGSLPLALVCGADYPAALFQMLAEGRTEFSAPNHQYVRCRSLAKDLGWMLQNMRADHSDPTLATRPIARDLIESFASAMTLREHMDTLAIDDPKPGIWEIGRIGAGIFWGLARRIARRASELPPSRRYLQRRARRALVGAKSVLVVCKGNICRSPFAEHVLRQSLPAHTEVVSAGFYPKKSRLSPEVALAAAERVGVDFSTHRSKVIDRELIDEADCIFVFDQENYRSLKSRFPDASKKTYFYGALDSRGPLIIRDPYGEDQERFVRTYRLIQRALEWHNGCVQSSLDVARV